MNETQNIIPNYLEDYLIGRPIPAGGSYVWPWGNDNLYPQMIREVTRENGLLQNILNKHFEMLWGSGPQLYETGFANGWRYKRWVQNKDIEDWLSTWDWRQYIERVTAEYLLLNGYFTKVHSNVKPFSKLAVEKLEFIESDWARIQWTGTGEPITGVITGDFSRPGLFGYDRLPVFDAANPRAQEISMSFEYLPQSGVEFYPRAPIHSSLSWIQADEQSASRVEAFNCNSISPKYHIEVPALYWVKIREKLIAECQEKGTVYTDAILDRAKDQTFEEVSNALSGIEKAGKFLVTEILHDELIGKYVRWKVIPLEAHTKDYFESELKINRESQFNITSGLGVHPSIIGLQKDGGLSSGSEGQVATKLYKHISVDIAEKIIMKNLNAAIEINFSGFRVKMGFCRDEY
ncbi:MAG: hypothetical protein WCR01_11345 [Bacteroidota bacterium]